MKVIHSIDEMQSLMKQIKQNENSVGYVPTMGFLHKGHLSLVEEARKENDIVVMSIFVNPLQFGPNEDFDQYPRDFERDEKLAREAGVDIIFYPSSEEMYPNQPSLNIHVRERVNVLCGKSREGHFDGVAMVLMKLFNIVICDRAYFGLKDAQQVAVVDGLVKDLNFPVQIIPVDIVREEDGLAKSSRNVNLTEQEREQAPAIYKSLKNARSEIINGLFNPTEIKHSIIDYLTTNTEGSIDYVEIYSYPELKPISTIEDKVIIAVALKFSKVRLIDNIIIK